MSMFTLRPGRNRRRSLSRTTSILRIERLEDRTQPSAAFYVDDTWAGTQNGQSPSPDPVGGLVFGTNAFADIQSAINAVPAGDTDDTVVVYGGNYPGAVNINKALATLQISTNSGNATETTVAINGAVTLTNSAIFVENGSTNLTFGAAVDAATAGGAGLTVNGNNTTTFAGPVGGAFALASLTTDASGSTILSSGPAGSVTGLGTANGLSGGNEFGITAGPDGNLWFTEVTLNRIGRITPAGAVTEFGTGLSLNANPDSIALGPDGNLWFTENTGNRVGRITPAGVITEFSAGIAGSDLLDITAGPDGNLWFTEGTGNRIGRITPAGVITEFTVGISAGSQPVGIAAGPDGNLWFTEQAGNRIGRITPAGVVTEFSMGISANSGPNFIAAGPDGNLWFTEFNGNRIARITPAGAVTEFGAANGLSAGASPNGIALGPDGNLWFTEFGNQHIGRITTGGAVTEFPTGSSANVSPLRITAGPDGNVWFTEGLNSPGVITGRIGRVTAGGTVITTGSQTYNDAVTVPSNEALTSTAGNVAFIGTINSDGARAGRLTVTAAQVQIGGAVGGVNPLAGLAVNDAGPASVTGTVQGAGTTFTKAGAGTLTLGNANTYTGPTTVSGGTLSVTGSTAATSAVTVSGGATLAGTGTVNGTITTNGGTLAPGTAGPGLLSSGGLTLGPDSTFAVDVNSPFAAAGTDYDQARVAGSVTINGAVLNLTIGNPAPAPNRVITLIDNDGTDPVTVLNPFVSPAGTPLPEGSTITIGSFMAVLSYTGGDGNDVTLTRVAPHVTLARINNGAVQRSNIFSVTLTFNAVVTLPADASSAFTLLRLDDGAAVGFTAAASVFSGVSVVTLSGFTGTAATNFQALADGRYSLTALAGQITQDGVVLDGNNDGINGDNYVLADTGQPDGFYRLFGDANGDRAVNGLDITPFVNQFGMVGPGLAFDFNGDGAVNGLDITPFVNNFGKTL